MQFWYMPKWKAQLQWAQLKCTLIVYVFEVKITVKYVVCEKFPWLCLLIGSWIGADCNITWDELWVCFLSLTNLIRFISDVDWDQIKNQSLVQTSLEKSSKFQVYGPEAT